MKNTKILTHIFMALALTFAVFSMFSILSVSKAHAASTYPCYGYQCYDNSGYNNNGYYYSGSNQVNLQVSCYPSLLSANVGDSVTWYTNVSGGVGNYQFVWSGDENLWSNVSSAIKSYSYAGAKYATVVVTSGNQQITKACSNSVTVYAPQQTYYPYNNYNYPYSNSQPYYNYNPTVYSTSYPTAYPITSSNSSGLNITCYVDPATVSVNQPVTWSANVTGGMAPYSYSWTGSDALSGINKSAIKYYGSAGSKNAIVTVTSADGRSSTRACDSSLAVRGATSEGYESRPTVQYIQQVVTPPPATTTSAQNNNDLSANSLTSVSNVPWGWIAVLIILILFFTVLYLLFNRTKI